MPRRLLIDECYQLASNYGGKCLSKTYQNNYTPVLWVCKYGHEWQAKFNHVKAGSWCPKCAGIGKITIETCRRTALARGGECLSEIYENKLQKLLWRCHAGHEWFSIFSNIRAGKWCPRCSRLKAKFSIEDCKQLAKIRGGLCNSNHYENSVSLLEWQCAKGHKWRSTFGNIKSGRWCPECAGNRKKQGITSQGQNIKDGKGRAVVQQ